jgi:DNA-binding MarR family transcriptional regulator
MEASGLVRRTPSAEDGRVSLVHLTDRGRTLHDGVVDARAPLERRTIDGLSPDEQRQFIELAGMIGAALDQ